ncbi:MAG: hypothetical protein HYV97_12415 [Bdellovibrio sp.]|nr:hypothetical protein [Bdellovibrio sp.]
MLIRRNILLALMFLWIFPTIILAGPRIVHITKNTVIVRMGADGQDLVYQVVGTDKEDMELYYYNGNTQILKKISPPKKLRPFGPQVNQGKMLYAAGNFYKKVDVYLYDLKTNKHQVLEKDVAWIPTMALTSSQNGHHLFYDAAKDFDGLAAHVTYRGAGVGNMSQGPWQISGPIFRRADIPPQYHEQIKNEYPSVSVQPSNDPLMVFQNNEYGTPNIYSFNLSSKSFVRLSPSGFYQERPAVSERLIAWEESERGFSVSNESEMVILDRHSGELFRNFPKGFHFQVRAFGPYAIYGVKRAPSAATPSIRVYDVNTKVEYQAQNCFPGSIFDFVPVSEGLYVAQKVSSSSSRILFATWDEIKSECR